MAVKTVVQQRGIYDNSYERTTTVRPKSVQLVRSRTGDVLPKYKDLITKMKSATTPMSAYEQTCSIRNESVINIYTTPSHYLGKTSWTSTWGGISHGVNGHAYAIPLTDADYFVTSTHKDQALARARSIAANKVKDIQAPFNTQVFAAELREIRQLFRGPLLKYLLKLQQSELYKRKGVRSGKVKDRLSPKDISDEWLSLQFGLLPLIRDIRDIAKLFNEKTQSDDVNRIHAYSKVDGVVLDSATVGDTIAGVKFQQRLIRKGTVEVFITSGIAKQYQEKLSGIDALSQQLTNLMEVPVTVWESLPWSFLMDYFVNVGDTINATTLASASISYVSETVVRTVEYEGMSVCLGQSRTDIIDHVDVLQPLKSYKSKLRVVNRVGGSLGIPPLTVTLPGSNTRYANIAALFLSNLPK